MENIVTQQQLEVVTNLVEKYLPQQKGISISSVCAPEVGINYRVGVIKTDTKKFVIVNPEVKCLDELRICFGEACNTNFTKMNCFRYNKIVILNGFDFEKITFEGELAFHVQHMIDHFEGVTPFSKAIKIALVRDGGIILPTDWCPCASRLKFNNCCGKGGTLDIKAKEIK